MKVEQFLNRNQFHLYDDTLNVDILQSYNSKVVEITNNPGCYQCVKLGRDWDYSKTTSKHVYAFLEEYSKCYIGNRQNKRKYIIDLLKEYQENREQFLDRNNYAIVYDEEMV